MPARWRTIEEGWALDGRRLPVRPDAREAILLGASIACPDRSGYSRGHGLRGAPFCLIMTRLLVLTLLDRLSHSRTFLRLVLLLLGIFAWFLFFWSPGFRCLFLD